MNDGQSNLNRKSLPTRRHALKLAAGTTTVATLGSTLAAAQEQDRQQWAFETVGEASSTPTVVDETVFIGSYDTNLYAIDSDSGDQQWRFQTGGSILGSPNVVDGTVYIGSFGGDLYAVDAVTGNEKWSLSLAGSGEYASSPTIKNGTVFVGNTNGNLYARDAVTGDGKWTFQRDNEIDSSPTVVDGTVFISVEDDGLYAVNAETGDERWSFDTNITTSSPTVTDESVLIGGGNTLYALDPTNGELNGSFNIRERIGGAGGLVQSTPTVDDDTVFVTSDKTLAIDDNGNTQWVFDAGGASSPTVADGTVFFGAIDNNLYALDAETGEEQWAYDAGSEIRFSSPTVVDGTVYIGSQDGTVHAVNADITGSSEDSRVNLGTLGHTDIWAQKAGQFGVSYDNPTTDSGLLEVSQRTDALIEANIQTGETTTLPDQVEVRVVSTAAPPDFRLGVKATVGDEGSFSAEFDLGGTQVGDEFTTSVRNNGEIIDQTDSIIVETTPSQDVELRNVGLNPPVVDGTNPTHTLSFEVINLSPDDGQDDFSITLPSDVEVNNVSIVSAGDLNPTPSDPSPENPITFRVNPSETTEAQIVTELSLSPRD